VKRFLKTSGHADAYENLKVTFVPGHSPTLYLKNDDGSDLDSIDISGMTTDQLHKFFVSKGFERKAQGVTPGAENAL